MLIAGDVQPGGKAPPRHRQIKLLLSDIDGTLVTKEKFLSPANIRAVEALGEAGIAFAVTSSRPPKGMRMFIEPLKITTPIAGFNGGLFVKPDMTPIEEHSVPPDAARKSLEIILAQGVDAWVFCGPDWLVRDPDGPHVARESRTVQYKPEIVKDFSGVDFDRVGKIVAVSDEPPLMAACEAALKGAIGSIASASRSQPYYIDITHSDANKGAVVDWLSKSLGISRDEIATIGDMQNDVWMFRRAGLAIAMGNAKDDVKGEAHFVTASNEEDGFAKAINAVLIGQTKGENTAG